MSETKPSMPTNPPAPRLPALMHCATAFYRATLFCPGRMPMNTVRSSKHL